MPTISYACVGLYRSSDIVGCGGTQTTRITDLAGALVGSNPGQDATFTEQVQNGGKAKHSDKSWARYQRYLQFDHDS